VNRTIGGIGKGKRGLEYLSGRSRLAWETMDPSRGIPDQDRTEGKIWANGGWVDTCCFLVNEEETSKP